MSKIADSLGIGRAQLRAMPLTSLPAGVIRWDHRLRSMDDIHRLRFEHGIEEGFDLVDGAWSKARLLLSQEKPFYSGLCGYSLSVLDAKEKAPAASQLVNRESVFAFSDGKPFVDQQFSDGSINVSV
ncbi:hypothetical protein K432DRAFT_422083 [Lepidopterella palustris CBS 459.81]|uniref:Uncharacterized protein n=1 Tax=Lepidopterella palustris CBS 459.81 TaxID=1314670 RepID=A0A8E2EK96_9PEZI|nr:hypothetical protein K432DRAFT_422083 [Lepidopterella palustris CBS 459.81]